MHDFEVNLTKRVQNHPSLKALTIKGYCSTPLVKGAVAGMSKRDSVEKLVVTPLYDGKEPLCRVSLVSPHLSVDSVFVLLVCVVWWYSVVYGLFAHTVVQVPLCV